MNSSRKENHYYFKNLFLAPEEYDQILQQMRGQRNASEVLSTKRPPKKGHLKIVD
jgi:hypothetical protein